MRRRIQLGRKTVEYTKSVAFNNWISKYCKPSSEGLNVQDVDFFFQNFRSNPKEYFFLEVKQFVNTSEDGVRKPCMKPGQHAQFSLLDRVCKMSSADVKYHGFFELSISGETPDNSETIVLIKHFDSDYFGLEFELDPYQLRQFLNFQIDFHDLVKEHVK